MATRCTWYHKAVSYATAVGRSGAIKGVTVQLRSEVISNRGKALVVGIWSYNLICAMCVQDPISLSAVFSDQAGQSASARVIKAPSATQTWPRTCAATQFWHVPVLQQRLCCWLCLLLWPQSPPPMLHVFSSRRLQASTWYPTQPFDCGHSDYDGKRLSYCRICSGLTAAATACQNNPSCEASVHRHPWQLCGVCGT